MDSEIALLESGTDFQNEISFEKFRVALVIIATLDLSLGSTLFTLKGFIPDQKPWLWNGFSINNPQFSIFLCI